MIGNDLPTGGGDPLVCATQLDPCCGTLPNRFGDWFYPNGTMVPLNGDSYHFYRTRRTLSSMPNVLGGALLNRRYDAMGPTGIYLCTIPGADRVTQSLYVGLYANTNNGTKQL